MIFIVAAIAAAVALVAGYALGAHKTVKQAANEIAAEIVTEAKDEASQLREIVDHFQTKFAADWEAAKLGPLLHGIETMIEKLSA